MLFSIVGTIASGKTTVINELSKFHNNDVVYFKEPVKEWKKYFDDMNLNYSPQTILNLQKKVYEYYHSVLLYLKDYKGELVLMERNHMENIYCFILPITLSYLIKQDIDLDEMVNYFFCETNKECVCENNKECMRENNKEHVCETNKEHVCETNKEHVCETNKECVCENNKECVCENNKECMCENNKECVCENKKFIYNICELIDVLIDEFLQVKKLSSNLTMVFLPTNKSEVLAERVKIRNQPNDKYLSKEFFDVHIEIYKNFINIFSLYNEPNLSKEYLSKIFATKNENKLIFIEKVYKLFFDKLKNKEII